MNIFWKGGAISKIVNILAVCERFLDGSYCFHTCEHFGSLNIFWKGAADSKLVNILAVCEHFLEGAAVSKIVNILAVCERFLEGSYCFHACEHFG